MPPSKLDADYIEQEDYFNNNNNKFNDNNNNNNNSKTSKRKYIYYAIKILVYLFRSLFTFDLKSFLTFLWY
jgi:hypothetical protein